MVVVKVNQRLRITGLELRILLARLCEVLLNKKITTQIPTVNITQYNE